MYTYISTHIRVYITIMSANYLQISNKVHIHFFECSIKVAHFIESSFIQYRYLKSLAEPIGGL